MHRPSKISSGPAADYSEDSEPRDTGTFKATLPELGGFLTEDGEPVQPEHDEAEPWQPRHRVSVPFYREDVRQGSGLWITLTSTLMVVCLVATALVTLLLYALSADDLGQAGSLISVLRSSVF